MRVIIALLILASFGLYAQSEKDSNDKTYEYIQKAKVKSAQKEIDITVISVDISEFPMVKIIIEAYNKLGEPLNSLSPDSLYVYEDGVKKNILEVVKMPSPEKIEVDFIFMIDVTGSMQQKINQVRDNITKFSASLMKRGIDYRTGLILFSDEIERVYQPTNKVSDFLMWTENVKATGGYDEKENALEAIKTGVKNIKFRKNAQRVLVLITDAPYHQSGEDSKYGLTDQTTESIIEMLQRSQTRVFSIVPEKLNLYEKISELSRGNAYDIDFPFAKILDNFSTQLTNIYTLKYSSAKETIPDSIQIAFFSGAEKKFVKKTIPIVELGRKLIIENLLFKLDKADLPEDVKELNILAEFMESKDKISILIEGHTDSWGSATYNQRLSKLRAESVKNYLINKGISADRIDTKGYGEERPIATNETEFGRKLNRRTEIIIFTKE
jgi:outer membrane protein OmpA-like peptidoglycan-associated protein/Mg-chelatase subunit ChlD